MEEKNTFLNEKRKKYNSRFMLKIKKNVKRSDYHYNEFNKKNYKSWKKENTP